MAKETGISSGLMDNLASSYADLIFNCYKKGPPFT